MQVSYLWQMKNVQVIETWYLDNGYIIVTCILCLILSVLLSYILEHC